uniref:Protein regulator of cytokinesis 1a n=1 Tax=Gasterosteus aculeatus aculeatus TaxID=481459 RepID=G3NRC1_GASAC
MRVSEVHAAECGAYLNRAQVRLQEIWDEIGIPEEQRVQRTNDVHKHIKGLLDLMITEEEQLKKRLLKNIELCVKELHNLCSELQLPSFEEDGCTMLQMEKNSRTRLEVMKGHKKQRMEELKGLVSKDRELCGILSTTPFYIDTDCTPSLKQLEAYHAYMDDLTKEKERRHEEFVAVKKEIIVFMEDLERNPETSFEMDVIYEDEEEFCLSIDNMAALKLFLSQLQEHKAENERCCSALRSKIHELWERLLIPQEEREAFSEHMVKTKKRNVEALQAEVQRLEVLKMQSMKTVIEAIRAEIALFWEKCFYSEEQRQSFVPYYDDDFTEELLNLHEAEIGTLKMCYEGHRTLLDGVTKWQENWTLYMELDKRANDPSRFTNRGGNLLKEEKQRADLQKSLPKLEKSLKAQIDAWVEEHGKEFLVNGQKFLEYVQQQWDYHHAEKEKEKQESQVVWNSCNEQLHTKRRVAGTPTPGKCTQRVKIEAGFGFRTPGQGKTPRALDRNKENISNLRSAPSGTLRSQDTHDNTFTMVASSYSEFTRDLSKASNVKSAVLNSTVSHQ